MSTRVDSNSDSSVSSASNEAADMIISVQQPDAKKHDVGILGSIPEDKYMVLRFERLNAYVSTQVDQPGIFQQIRGVFRSKQDDAPKERQIMHNIQGELQPFEVLAIMGPSGSGKTSLMSVISGRKPQSVRLTGKVTVNGAPLTKPVKRLIGYVSQDDLLYETLTVEETLSYAAALRLPESVPAAEKMARVDGVLQALGLSKCRNTLIGGHFRRGVSGGERKRVSIGHELLINPSIILLDEPTSGLDSTTALHLITTLRQLAAGGRAIGTTIHQPSSRLYQQLDRLMLLAEGHCCYYGPADEVVPWFKQLGFEMPYGVNVADFILDLATGEVPSTSGLSGQDAIRAVYHSYENFAVTADDGLHDSSQIQELQLVEEDEGWKGAEEAAAARAADAEAGSVVVKAKHEPGLRNTVKRWGGLGNRGGASYTTQLLVLLSRCNKVARQETLSIQKLAQFIVVAFIAGMFWWQSGRTHTIAKGTDTLGLLFFEMVFPAYTICFAALFLFPSSYKLLLKERASGMYRLSAFYIAQTVSDLPLDLFLPTLFAVIVYFFGGLKLTAGAFFANWAALLLILLTAQSLGLLLGVMFMNAKNAMAAATVVVLTCMLCGGFFVRNIPVWIGWLRYLSFVYWGYDLLVKINFSNTSYVDCSAGPCTPVTNLQQALSLTTWPNDSVWPEVVVLIGFMLAMRVAVYAVLRVRTRPL